MLPNSQETSGESTGHGVWTENSVTPQSSRVGNFTEHRGGEERGEDAGVQIPAARICEETEKVYGGGQAVPGRERLQGWKTPNLERPEQGGPNHIVLGKEPRKGGLV